MLDLQILNLDKFGRLNFAVNSNVALLAVCEVQGFGWYAVLDHLSFNSYSINSERYRRRNRPQQHKCRVLQAQPSLHGKYTLSAATCKMVGWPQALSPRRHEGSQACDSLLTLVLDLPYLSPWRIYL